MAWQITRILLLLTTVLLWALPAWATTYWVSNSLGSAGNCGNAQGSTPPANYLRSIGAGMGCLSSGDTLYIRSGTYAEFVTSGWVNGSAGAYTRYARYPNDPVGSVVIRPNSGNIIFDITGNRSYIEVDGITMDGSNMTGQWIFSIRNQGRATHHIRIQNCEITHHWSGPGGPSVPNILGGLFEDHMDSIELLRNNFHHNSNYGIYFGGRNSFIDGNTFDTNGGYGIQFYSGDDENPPINDNVVRNNLFVNNGFQTLSPPPDPGDSKYPAMVIAAGARTQFYNNIVRRNNAGIQVWQPNVQIYSNTFVENNDDYGSGFVILGPYQNPSNAIIKNNISYNNANNSVYTWAGTSTQSNNLLGVNPFFLSTAGGDFHIATAGSPAINFGADLGPPWNVDKEGFTRPAGQYTAGAYQFQGSPPQQLGNFGKWMFEAGTGTSAVDSSGQGHTCTLNTAGWGTGIIGNFSLNAAGVRECHVTTTTGMRPTSVLGGSLWVNGLTNGDYGYLVDMGGTWGLWHDPAGVLVFYQNGGGQSVATTGINILSGTNRHIAFTKDTSGLRIWIDGAQAAFSATTVPISYSGSEQFFIGRNALQVGNYFPGRIDQVYLYDNALDQTLVTQLFNEYVPTAGMSVTHSRFTTAGQAEGVFSAPQDTDDTRLVGQPVGIRWAIHRGDTGSLTEYFRVFCRVNSGAGYGAWTEVGNSFLGLGIRFYADGAVTLGQATSALLPLEGATATPGLFLENPVDTTAPYDAGQRLTMSLGQHAELEARLELSAPLVAGNTVQCRPQRENATVFESYGGSGDPAIRTLTLATPNTARALLGVQVIGGAVQ